MGWRVWIANAGLFLLAGCSYNPFSDNNHLTGNPAGAVIGSVAGGGATALLNAPKPVIAAGIIGGGIVGYYVTTQRFAAGGIIQAGGQVYQVGDYVGIVVPTDQLFEPNTATFLPQAQPVLDSIVSVLSRYPDRNIQVSGNTSGFGSSLFEKRLSRNRAKQVASYLWNNGINTFKNQSIETRDLNYVGYGDLFPIASDQTLPGLRANSRIQITVYPSKAELGICKRDLTFNNIGSTAQPG